MNNTVKLAALAVGGGVGTAIASDALKGTKFMQENPNAWYAEAAAAAVVGYLLRKKSASLSAALLGGAGMLAYQGYQNNEATKTAAANNTNVQVQGSIPTTLGGLLGQGATSDNAGAVLLRGREPRYDDAGAVIQRTRRGDW
jgi:uncharacterized membrane protein YebE (DUF533 family)